MRFDRSSQYVFTDAIVVWRAWVLCRVEYRKTLFVPIAFLLLTSRTLLQLVLSFSFISREVPAVSVFTTIGIRTATYFTAAGPNAPSSNPLIHALDICQVSNLVWSLLTNITATAIISHKAWYVRAPLKIRLIIWLTLYRRHRLVIKEGLTNIRNKTTRSERILALLIESGFLYCISGVSLVYPQFETHALTFLKATVLLATVIHLPFGTLGDIYTPINIQIAVRKVFMPCLFQAKSRHSGYLPYHRHRTRWFGADNEQYYVLER